MAAPADQVVVLDSLNRLLDVHPETAGREVLELPYRTFCYRAQREDDSVL
jgi:hypothetical protein